MAEGCCAILLAAAFATSQTLIGGTRLLFSLPAYGLLGLGGLLAFFALRRPKPYANQLCFASTALFFGYILARALFSPVPYLARSDIYSVLGGLLVYFFVACIFTEAKQRMLLLSVLLVLGIVHVCIGAVQFRQDNNFMLIPFLQRVDYGQRASGLYVCPNHLAGLLEVLAVFALSIVCWSRWPIWAKLLTAYAGGVSYLGLVLTGSRGGYLSTVASLLVFIALSLLILRKAPSRVFWGVGGASVVVVLLISVTAACLIRKSDYLSGRAETVFDTTNMRIEMWKAAIQQWKLEPVAGTGSGTYLFYGRQFRTEQVQRDPVYVHNDYLQLLAEYGLVGGALFLVFLASHTREGWRNFQRLGPKRLTVSSGLLSNGLSLQIGAIAALCAYIVHSVFDFNLHIPANVLLLAFVFGILANAGTSRERDPVSLRFSTIRWRLLLPIIGLIVVVQCVRLLPGEYFAERARTSLRDDELVAAISFALEGLKWEQKNPNLYQYLGSARAELADKMSEPQARSVFYEGAIRAFEKGRALAPEEKAFAAGMGMAYDALGRFAEAEWMYDQVLALDPKFIPTKQIYQAHLKQWRQGITPPPAKTE